MVGQEGSTTAETHAPLSPSSPNERPSVTTGAALAALPVVGNTAALAPQTLAPSVETEYDEKHPSKEAPHSTIPPSKKDAIVLETDEDDPEMAKLTDEQRRVVAAAVHLEKGKAVGFFELFRFHTRAELALNLVGVVFAIIAGKSDATDRLPVVISTTFGDPGLTLSDSSSARSTRCPSAGSTQPLMTVVFGALTTQFTTYGRAAAVSLGFGDLGARP